MNAVVPDDPPKELVVRGPRHAMYSRASMASAFSNRALGLNGALGLSKSSVENFLKHPQAILVWWLMSLGVLEYGEVSSVSPSELPPAI